MDEETQIDSSTRLPNQSMVPRGWGGRVIGGGDIPSPTHIQAPDPSTPGSASWVLGQAFDNPLQALEWLEGMVGDDLTGELPVGRMCVIAREWEDRQVPWTWNQVAKLAKVGGDEIFKLLSEGMKSVSRLAGQLQATKSLDLVIQSAIQNALTGGTQGFADRKLLMELAGAIEPASKGVNVQVNQQMGVKVEGLKGGGVGVMKAFRQTADEIDDQTRQAYADGLTG